MHGVPRLGRRRASPARPASSARSPGVVEETIVRTVESDAVIRALERIIEDGRLQAAIERSLSEEQLEEAIKKALDSELADRVWEEILASDKAQMLVERVADAPEVRAAIAAAGLRPDHRHRPPGEQADRGARRRRRARSPTRSSAAATTRRRPNEAGLVTRLAAAAIDLGLISGLLSLTSAVLSAIIPTLFGDNDGDGVSVAAFITIVALGLFFGGSALRQLLDADRADARDALPRHPAPVRGPERDPASEVANRRIWAIPLSVIPFGLGFLAILIYPERRGWHDRDRGHRGDLRRGVGAVVAGAAGVGPPGERRGRGLAGSGDAGRPRPHAQARLSPAERPRYPLGMPETAVNGPFQAPARRPARLLRGRRSRRADRRARARPARPARLRAQGDRPQQARRRAAQRRAARSSSRRRPRFPRDRSSSSAPTASPRRSTRTPPQRNLRTIDATCPLVTKVHVEARRFAEQGYTIVLVGHGGHEEVEGTTGEAPDSIVLVESAADVDALEVEDPERVALITQTTLSVDETADIIARLREKFPNITTPKSDDICYATTNRQLAVKQLAKRVRPRPRRRLEELLQLQPARRRDPRARHRLPPDRQRQPRSTRPGSRASRPSASPPARAPPRSSSPSSSTSSATAATEDVSELRAIDEDVRFMLPKKIRVELAGRS